jgi:MPBQ/MSBQ methyltransferase
MVIACWCQREETPARPLTDDDKARLKFLYEEWAHPFFISMQEFCRLMEVGWGAAVRR